MMQKISEAYGRTKDYLIDLAVHTKAEVVAGAIAGAIVLGSIGHADETLRSNFQPISYSEYEQIEDQAKKEERKLNETTWHYVGANEFPSKIAEAYNWNSIWGTIPELHRNWFSAKLEQSMDTTGRIYRRNITDFAKIIPEHARGALRELSDLTSASQESNDLRGAFRSTWSYNRDEEGHWYPVETCTSDDKGHQSCTTTMHYQCDYYHHTWTWHPSEGMRASQKLNGAKERVPEIKHLKIEVAPKTNAWNEQVIRQSFRHMKKREPTEAEMLEASHSYKTGSQYELHIDPAIGLWKQFTNSDSRMWQNYLSTAKTAKKTTGCHSTSGPIEFEFAQDIQERFGVFINHEQSITTGIRRTITEVPKLEQKIKEFFVKQNPSMGAHFPEINRDNIKKSSARLSREIISEARSLYRANIPKGNEDTSYRFGVLLAYTLLGSLLGGLVGLGADALVDRYVVPGFNNFRNNAWKRY
jgi:hypothetical protein